ncbi:hypothetical protein B0W44_12685 [Novibacillus thermophilus]|uniref:Oxidoreductase n=1 Tax=Novibacillus thermophilus TaxID=1471761 RepID=A0A1U9K8Y8_9BACL|nr:hypothetical protein B0W44_12685 [Novibacillus thermophilus]
MFATVRKRVAIVTGASSGIGYAIAAKLAERSVAVVAAARGMVALEKAASHIQAKGGDVLPVPADVSRFQDFQILCEKAVQHYGTIDILVNSAGIMPLSFLRKRRVEEWHAMIDTNIKGVTNGIAAVLPQMEKKNAGCIINISSTAAYEVMPGGAVYSATKYAVRAITEGLRKELEMKKSKIKTILVSPGPVDTNLTSTIQDEEILQFMQSFPVCKIHPKQIADTVLFLLDQPENVNISEIVIRPM